MQAGPRKGKGGVEGKAAEPAGPLALTGWVLFDWATQPFYTLVVTFLFGPYFVNGFIGDPALGATLWAYATGGAELIAALLAPILGSIAAAITCERQGNVPVTPAEAEGVLDALERRARYV